MRNPDASGNQAPRVAVLLATHNGMRWLDQQLASILDQRNVAVRVIAMDDGSTDGTDAWLRETATHEPRLTVLADDGTAGGSAANFYRLLTTTDIAPDELLALADQDDIWHPDKLARHAALLAERGVDGVSSSIIAFDDTSRTLIRKDYPQRGYDYLLESPGPGCTFLLSSRFAAFVADILRREPAARAVYQHDCLIYALGRAHGWAWYIDGRPSVDYRQHDRNVMGANTGLAAARARVGLIRSHWLRDHAVRLAEASLAVASENNRGGVERMLALFGGRGIRSRLALMRASGQLRRRPRDQRIIAVVVATGMW